MRIFIVFIIMSTVLGEKTFALDPVAVVEHQIRLCEDSESILSKLNLEGASGKKREILYAETLNRFYQLNNWTIRLKVKSDKVEVDLKRRVKKSTTSLPFPGVECEYDRHGDTLEKTCKMNHEISLSKLQKIINDGENWTGILSGAQEKWLKSTSEIQEETLLYGVLKDFRYEVKHALLGDITLDLVHLAGDKTITFHEISVRYVVGEENPKRQLFEDFVKAKKLKTCADQLDWSINKFDVMTSLNFFQALL